MTTTRTGHEYQQTWITRITTTAAAITTSTGMHTAVEGLQLAWQTTRAVTCAETLDTETTWMSLAEAITATRDGLAALPEPYGRITLGAGIGPAAPLNDTAELRAAVHQLLHSMHTALHRHAQHHTGTDPATALRIATAAGHLQHPVQP